MVLLLVEPDKILGSSYARGLEQAAFRVIWAKNAEQAIHSTDDLKPDIIVLEPKISSHSGIEFLHELRSYEDWLNIQVVVYSSVPSYAFGLDELTWQQFGVARYLEKSKTSVKELAAICHTILEDA
jgi:DNA-binding response OmpR family regulator